MVLTRGAARWTDKEETRMPSFRKLGVAEIAALEQPSLSERAQRIREYDVYLAEFVAGDYGRAELAAGDRRTLVRSRLQAAARRRGLALRFRPGPNPALIFHVKTAPPPVIRPALTPAVEADQQRPKMLQRGPVRRDAQHLYSSADSDLATLSCAQPPSAAAEPESQLD